MNGPIAKQAEALAELVEFLERRLAGEGPGLDVAEADAVVALVERAADLLVLAADQVGFDVETLADHHDVARLLGPMLDALTEPGIDGEEATAATEGEAPAG